LFITGSLINRRFVIVDRATQTPYSWSIRKPPPPKHEDGNNLLKSIVSIATYAVPAAVVGVLSVIAAPVVLGVVGFTRSGIAGGNNEKLQYQSKVIMILI